MQSAINNLTTHHESLSLYSLTKQILNVILILNRLSTVRWQTLYHWSLTKRHKKRPRRCCGRRLSLAFSRPRSMTSQSHHIFIHFNWISSRFNLAYKNITSAMSLWWRQRSIEWPERVNICITYAHIYNWSNGQIQ